MNETSAKTPSNSTENITAIADAPAAKKTEINNVYIMGAMLMLFTCACGLGAYSFRKRKMR